MLRLVGAGSLGRLWAACLPESERCFIARPDRPASTLNYRFQSVAGDIRPVSAELVPAASIISDSDLVLMFTKARDTLPALDALSGQLPEAAAVVLFQNGMSSHEAVAAAYPDRPILSASTTEGANRPDEDTLVHAGKGKTWVGGLTSSGRECSAAVVSALRTSGLEVHRTENIREQLLRKLVINAGINPYTAILNLPNGEILKAPLYLNTIDDLCNEMVAVLARHNLPQSSESLRQSIEDVAQRTAQNCSSMRADVLNHRLTEIEAINGYFVSEGERLGLPVEVNRFLVDSVHQLH